MDDISFSLLSPLSVTRFRHKAVDSACRYSRTGGCRSSPA